MLQLIAEQLGAVSLAVLMDDVKGGSVRSGSGGEKPAIRPLYMPKTSETNGHRADSRWSFCRWAATELAFQCVRPLLVAAQFCY